VRIRTIILDDFMRRTADDERAAVGEVAGAPNPVTNKPYPPGAALPTLPPLLLLRLPRLPENLRSHVLRNHLARQGRIVDSGVVTRREIEESTN
jgi:hypothetical protein